VSLHFLATSRHRRRGRQGEGRVYSGQETDVIESKPVVKIQSASTTPGITTSPRSVVQVPMTTDSGGVAPVVPMLPGDGQLDEGEDDESENDDDEEEVHEVNHEKLPRAVVHTT
jgi:hypothetical protein